MCGAPLFREIRPGFERLPPGHDMPRHSHFAAYATVVLDGGFEQAGYAGRMRLVPGDVLIQPTLDRHASRMRPGRGLHLLRLAWRLDGGLGGVYRLAGIDQVIAAAERDPTEAAGLLAETVAGAEVQAPLGEDWPDLLAADLARARRPGLGAWAEASGLAAGTLSRGFGRVFGVTPRAFGAELSARRAWLRSTTGADGLARIAADLGYADQAHMTRAVRALTGAPPGAWRRHAGSNGFKTPPTGPRQAGA